MFDFLGIYDKIRRKNMVEELTLKNDIIFKIFFSKAGHEKYLYHQVLDMKK